LAFPINIKEKAFTMIEIINGLRLLNLETNQPENGKLIKELIGIKINSEPNSASFRLKLAFILGIRDAQLAKLTPTEKKINPIKTLCFCADGILNF